MRSKARPKARIAARCRLPPRRASFFVAVVGCSLAYGQSESEPCEDLPPSARAACLMAVACASIDDMERRNECFRAAAERFEAVVEETPPAEVATPVDTEAIESVGPGPVSPEIARSPQAEDDPPTVAPSPQPVQTTTAQVPEPAEEADDVWRLVEVPRRFSASLIGVRTLARGRLLLGLDNELLFEGGGSHVSRLEVGDVLDAFRVSYSARRYRFVGPSHRPFEASRIRCEHPNPTADTRRKCALLKRWLSRPDS